jgi:hypothetical protein
MSKPEKPAGYSSIRALLNRVFSGAKREAQNPPGIGGSTNRNAKPQTTCWIN